MLTRGRGISKKLGLGVFKRKQKRKSKKIVMNTNRSDLNEHTSVMNERRAEMNENHSVMNPIRGEMNEKHSGITSNRGDLSEEEDEYINFGIISSSSNEVPNPGVNFESLGLAGPNVNEYAGPAESANALSMHDFRLDPPSNQVLGYGISKTVWSNHSHPHAIVNATREQHHVREKAKEEYNFTKILRAKFRFFPNVSQIPHLIGKKFNKFVYFSEMAQKVPLTTREEGEFYLREGSKMFESLYETPDEYFMLLLDIKPENFGIVDRDGERTLIWLDIDTQCIMAVRKRPKKKDFYIKYQQLLLLLKFFQTRCPGKEELCISFATKFDITKYDLQSFLNHEFESKEEEEEEEEKEKEKEKERKRREDQELAAYHQRFLLSCRLTLSANDTARAFNYGYFISPPYHLRFYINSKVNYELFKNLLPPDSIARNFKHNNYNYRKSKKSDFER